MRQWLWNLQEIIGEGYLEHTIRGATKPQPFCSPRSAYCNGASHLQRRASTTWPNLCSVATGSSGSREPFPAPPNLHGWLHLASALPHHSWMHRSGPVNDRCLRISATLHGSFQDAEPGNHPWLLSSRYHHDTNSPWICLKMGYPNPSLVNLHFPIDNIAISLVQLSNQRI